jgi:hypothetical protein
MAIAGLGPGSIGSVNRRASSKIDSDPHNPHRPSDVEIVAQVLQYTARSTGIETSPGCGRIIVTFRTTCSNLVKSRHPFHQATDRAASFSSSATSAFKESSLGMVVIDSIRSLSMTATNDASPICSAKEFAL